MAAVTLSQLSPMLLGRADGLPGDGAGLMMEPKWDGFRVLVATDVDGVRVCSRHGTDLSGLAPVAERDLRRVAPAGTVFDGELICLADVDGRTCQDFTRLRRLAFGRRPSDALAIVVWDVLVDAGVDRCSWALRDRRDRLTELVPRASRALTCSPELEPVERTRRAVLVSGFEGVVLKRLASTYRLGARSNDWRKLKARYELDAEVLGRSAARAGQPPRALIRLADGTRCWAMAFATAAPGDTVTVRYARRDADGGLRDAHLTAVGLTAGAAADSTASAATSR